MSGKYARSHDWARVSKRAGTPHESESAYVGVVQDRTKDPVHDEEAGENLHLGPPGHHERTANPGDLRPVEREDAHPEAAGDTEQLVDNNVLRLGPADEREDGERGKEVSCDGS